MATIAVERRADAESKLAREQRASMTRTAYLYILPAALVMLLINFWPLFFQLWMSFTNYSNRNLRTDNLLLQVVGSLGADRAAFNSPEIVGLDNYLGIFAAAISTFPFWRILLFNLAWTFLNLVFHVTIGVAIALLLNQEGMWFKRFYRALYIIPWAMPALISAMIWRNMFDDQSGAVNQLLRLAGQPGNVRWLQEVDPPFTLIPPFLRVPDWADPFSLLLILFALIIVPYFFRWVRERWLPFTIVWLIGLELFFVFALPFALNGLRGILTGAPPDPNSTLVGLGNLFPLSFYAVLIANIWLGWPFMMTIATGALQSIPRELYEAAEMDGASAWQTFWAITAPLLRPAMVPAIMIGMTWTFNQFNVIYFISGGGPLHQTEILVTVAYRLVNEVTVNLPGIGSVRPYGIAAAFAYIVFAILATLTLMANRVSRATESYAE